MPSLRQARPRPPLRLSVTDLLAGPTIDELAGKILAGLDLAVGAPVPVLAGAGAAAWEEGSL